MRYAERDQGKRSTTACITFMAVYMIRRKTARWFAANVERHRRTTAEPQGISIGINGKVRDLKWIVGMNIYRNI